MSDIQPRERSGRSKAPVKYTFDSETDEDKDKDDDDWGNEKKLLTVLLDVWFLTGARQHFEMFGETLLFLRVIIVVRISRLRQLA